jgi:hypothetical protein
MYTHTFSKENTLQVSSYNNAILSLDTENVGSAEQDFDLSEDFSTPWHAQIRKLQVLIGLQCIQVGVYATCFTSCNAQVALYASALPKLRPSCALRECSAQVVPKLRSTRVLCPSCAQVALY